MISYKPLRHLLTEHEMSFSDLRDELKIGTNTNVKMKNDSGYVSLEVLDKIGNYFSNKIGKTIVIQNLIEFIPDVPGE